MRPRETGFLEQKLQDLSSPGIWCHLSASLWYLLSWNYFCVLIGFHNPMCYCRSTHSLTVVHGGCCCWVTKMSKGGGKHLEELKKCSLGVMEKWALSEANQESKSSGRVLRSWRAVQSLGVQREDCTGEGQWGAGHPFQAPKAVSSHGEAAAADPTQAPFWQADVSITYLATIEHPGFGGGMSGEKDTEWDHKMQPKPRDAQVSMCTLETWIPPQSTWL